MNFEYYVLLYLWVLLWGDQVCHFYWKPWMKHSRFMSNVTEKRFNEDNNTHQGRWMIVNIWTPIWCLVFSWIVCYLWSLCPSRNVKFNNVVWCLSLCVITRMELNGMMLFNLTTDLFAISRTGLLKGWYSTLTSKLCLGTSAY